MKKHTWIDVPKRKGYITFRGYCNNCGAWVQARTNKEFLRLKGLHELVAETDMSAWNSVEEYRSKHNGELPKEK